jgi:hypothetical protein
MAVKTEHVLLGVAGGGVLLIGGYFWYSEYEKNKHIDEYLDKVQRAEIAYQNAIDAENYEKAQQVLDFYQGIMDSEEKIINAEGGHTKLVKALTRLIGVAFAGALTYKIIDWLLKKYPPPNIKCPYDGSTFPTSKALEQHLLDVHGQELVPAQVPAAKGAYDKLKDWIKSLLSATSGVARSALDRDWGNLPTIDIVAIALAAALILALIFLNPFGWFSGLPAIAAMVV